MKPFLRLLLGALWLAFASSAPAAVSVGDDYKDSYSLTVLGSAPGVPANYGGLTIRLNDPGTLLLGGDANSEDAKIYGVQLKRDTSNHITGFAGVAMVLADAYGVPPEMGDVAGGIDGGLAYGPELDDVLFYTTYPDNHIGQIELGSLGPDKFVDLTPIGVGRSVGGLTFVPAGMPGAGRLKIVSSTRNRWYDASVTPDGTGTYDIVRNTGVSITIRGGPEGIVYVPPGSPLFPTPSVLIAELLRGRVSSYKVNTNGDPIGTDKTFISGLANFDGFEGAAIDPLTGDFLFSTFGSNQILRVSAIPEPGTWLLLALGLAILGAGVRRSGRTFGRRSSGPSLTTGLA